MQKTVNFICCEEELPEESQVYLCLWRYKDGKTLYYRIVEFINESDAKLCEIKGGWQDLEKNESIYAWANLPWPIKMEDFDLDEDCWTCVNYGNDMYEDENGCWQSLCKICKESKEE